MRSNTSLPKFHIKALEIIKRQEKAAKYKYLAQAKFSGWFFEIRGRDYYDHDREKVVKIYLKKYFIIEKPTDAEEIDNRLNLLINNANGLRLEFCEPFTSSKTLSEELYLFLKGNNNPLKAMLKGRPYDEGLD